MLLSFKTNFMSFNLFPLFSLVPGKKHPTDVNMNLEGMLLSIHLFSLVPRKKHPTDPNMKLEGMFLSIHLFPSDMS